MIGFLEYFVMDLQKQTNKHKQTYKNKNKQTNKHKQTYKNKKQTNKHKQYCRELLYFSLHYIYFSLFLRVRILGTCIVYLDAYTFQ